MTEEEALELAQEAVTHWAGCEGPRLISHRENAVFAMVLPRAERGVLRLHRRGYQSEEAIRSELWWMEALAAAGLSVPRPQRTDDGALLAQLADGRISSVLGWVAGDPLGEGGEPLAGSPDDQMRRYASAGRAIAQLHVATDRLHLPPSFTRPHWDIEGLLGPAPFWGRFWDHPSASEQEAILLQEARRFARERLSDYAAQGADQGLIHADLLRENILFDGHQAHLIDFDDCGFGFRLYDLGTALSQNLEEPALDRIATGLVEGYGTLRPLTDDDVAMLPVFVMLRTLASVGWTMPRLAPGDPRIRGYLNRAVRTAHAVLEGQRLFRVH
ncbi:Ser/Thr protein kinase RdoA involved in Cpx stress response, MazF antagonist [Rhodovulum sp. ES.010]|uniref:phosphotransferase enzyme family protein n=1 Tax=Rhodovulum sp. ES.010 TaxID=1882821 RepID=UPI00092A2AE8|nr:phosphotransferase [Rhodovulum sp. ES.010]SIO50688.1 Ser/Thr protein kinase RdoA involved in Cpx stress response, MazF antagonist [Rhodovulum sp. ES.010]